MLRSPHTQILDMCQVWLLKNNTVRTEHLIGSIEIDTLAQKDPNGLPVSCFSQSHIRDRFE